MKYNFLIAHGMHVVVYKYKSGLLNSSQDSILFSILTTKDNEGQKCKKYDWFLKSGLLSPTVDLATGILDAEF